MVEASRRAAGPVRRGGLDNARFVLAAAAAIPAALAGRAHLATGLAPWGSARHGCGGPGGGVAAGGAGLVAPGGALQPRPAPAARDGLAGVPTTSRGVTAAVARAFEPEGF